ncbi:dihydroorotate dehydrogenase [Striga asiatica]|uniref:Dihydroorotate dehydrogenase n=1 Tax=Striga asiatica TaxID=4170 RepID=A0A5A7QLJ7_STRAF|nr:dihydroorotate dehydrogenase [Striga asiatica]
MSQSKGRPGRHESENGPELKCVGQPDYRQDYRIGPQDCRVTFGPSAARVRVYWDCTVGRWLGADTSMGTITSGLVLLVVVLGGVGLGVLIGYNRDPEEGTKNYGIQYQYNEDSILIGYTDRIFSRSSKKQDCVEQSSAEAEYVADALTTSQAIWLRRILGYMGEHQETHALKRHEKGRWVSGLVAMFSARSGVEELENEN